MELKQSNSRRKLAEIMGADPDNFSDSDVQVSLLIVGKYLTSIILYTSSIL